MRDRTNPLHLYYGMTEDRVRWLITLRKYVWPMQEQEPLRQSSAPHDMAILRGQLELQRLGTLESDWPTFQLWLLEYAHGASIRWGLLSAIAGASGTGPRYGETRRQWLARCLSWRPQTIIGETNPVLDYRYFNTTTRLNKTTGLPQEQWLSPAAWETRKETSRRNNSLYAKRLAARQKITA